MKFERDTGGDEVPSLEAGIGYTFRDRNLAGEALTHASRSNESPGMVCNERLEFLGDAVLELIVSTFIYGEYLQMSEGRMTKMRAAVVSEPSLAKVAEQTGLPGLIRMDKPMERGGGRQNPSILSDAVEAVIGAVYLDSGLEAARAFILPRLMDGIRAAAEDGFSSDHKTRLQELLQRNGEVKIEYILEETGGAPHERVFTVAVSADGKRLASGQGRSKKEAQQQAAGNALEILLNHGNESGSSHSAPEKT